MNMGACPHEQFNAIVAVARFEDSKGFMADIRIQCAQCGAQFEFLGLEPGVDNQGARVSIDGKEARIAITPPGLRPNPLQRISFDITRETFT